MPNSDNTFGTFNKQTKIYAQNATATKEEMGVGSYTVFADVNAAKTWFLEDAALTVYDECCTNLQWALVSDAGQGGNTKLKVTCDFGTKGAGTTEANDWAGQFKSRKQALVDANGWLKNNGTITDDSTHLF